MFGTCGSIFKKLLMIFRLLHTALYVNFDTGNNVSKKKLSKVNLTFRLLSFRASNLSNKYIFSFVKTIHVCLNSLGLQSCRTARGHGYSLIWAMEVPYYLDFAPGVLIC